MVPRVSVGKVLFLSLEKRMETFGEARESDGNMEGVPIGSDGPFSQPREYYDCLAFPFF
jgi:hypothetical protein